MRDRVAMSQRRGAILRKQVKKVRKHCDGASCSELLSASLWLVRYAGILSAYGMALADVVHEAQEPCAVEYSSGLHTLLHINVEHLTVAAKSQKNYT